jgi:protein ImuB
MEVQEIFPILRKWGIRTLGQLAALDKEQLGARLGPEAIRMWERANGRCNRVLKFVRPPELFEENFEFEHEVETAEPLLFMLRRFLEHLAIRLSSIYLVAKELTLHITFANPPQDGSAGADKQRYERVFKIPQPTNDIDLLFRMLQTHLENFRSKHPIIAVTLRALPIKPASEQFGLFETTLRNPHQLSETLARLSALMGADRVGTPILEETHRPDAFRMEPFSWAVESAVPTAESSNALRTPIDREQTAHATAVLRRFRPAVPASVLLDADTPAHVRTTEIWGEIIVQRGPYFISGNWWDNKSWARAEWDLELENGELVRAHESPPALNCGVAGAGTWKVDGIYD